MGAERRLACFAPGRSGLPVGRAGVSVDERNRGGSRSFAPAPRFPPAGECRRAPPVANVRAAALSTELTMRMWKMAGTLALLCTTLIGSPVRAQPRQLLPRLSRRDVKHRLSVERASKRVVQREIGVDLIPPASPLAKPAQGPLLASAEVAPPSGEATPPRAAPAPVQPKTIRESAGPDSKPETGEEDGQVVRQEREDPSNATAPEPDAADVDGTGGGGTSAPKTPADVEPDDALLGAAQSKGGSAAGDTETIHIVVLDGSGFTQVRDIQSPISGERHQLVRDDQGRLIEIVRDREGNMLSARDVGPEELPQ